MKVQIHKANQNDVHDVATLIGEYRSELVALTNHTDFEFQINNEKIILSELLDNTDYAVFIARSVRGHPLGYMTVFESIPYLDDSCGILEQIYVRPFYRQRRIAHRMFQEIRQYAEKRRWRRLLVTLPRTISLPPVYALFEKQGFANAGKRKQWLLIEKNR